MPWCPNPDCPHRERAGRPAEYLEGHSTCADCGTALVVAPSPTRPRPGWPPPLLEDLGLRPLDHLVAADGQPLGGGLDVAAALGRMLTEPAVTWDLRREGRPLTLTLAIDGPPVALSAVPPEPAP